MPHESARSPIWRSVRRTVRLAIDSVPVLNRLVLTSAGHRALTPQEAEAFARSAPSDSWLRAVNRQQKIYNRMLLDMHRGQPRSDFLVAAQAVLHTGLRNPSLLEVGCGTGYYSEILNTLVPGGVRYQGMDYSDTMIAVARERYPEREFMTGDTTRISLPDKSFDIVMDGVSLMHILDYRKAVSEISRVASQFVIFHCLPVFERGETAYLTKYAYGCPVIEVVFGPDELDQLLHGTKLEVVERIPSLHYDVSHIVGRHSRFLTYVCRKKQ